MDDPLQMSEWLHPDKVMKLSMKECKKRALAARMAKTNSDNQELSKNTSGEDSKKALPLKRKNPFSKSDPEKKLKGVAKSSEVVVNEDSTMFEWMNGKPDNSTSMDNILRHYPVSFANALSKLSQEEELVEVEETPSGEKYIPMDWTLSKKMRIMSEDPLPWNTKCKASEEASGITGFVRCIDTGETESTLDTSLNAR